MSGVSTTMTITEIAATVWGVREDARFWDGWRDYGDAWARRYLRGAVRRGTDRCGSADAIAAADAALSV